jgi:8-oxo-dGTP pyrophosphatase MutT (NUDIX family)
VVRGDDVVVIRPARRHNHNEVWALPKGHPDGDETPLEAAAREVLEETGVEGDLIAELGEVEYTYERGGTEVRKRVAFFLFQYRRGELSHDHEIAAVRWMPLQEAAHALTHAGEREMVQRALSHARTER